jgi:hypothetical protein
MAPIALQWAVARDSYLARELSQFLIAHYKITPALLELRFKSNQRRAFENYVDWIKAKFTEKGFHTGLDGKPHNNPKQPYRATERARLITDRTTIRWP